MKKINCDVVVVGAGPGGSMAAKTCAKYGLDTVLVERKEYPSKPHSITCHTTTRLQEYIKIDKKFVDFPIYGMKQYFYGREVETYEPDGFELGYILNRKTFDKEILKLALKEGPEYLNKTRATGLIREDGKIKGIEAKIDEKEDIEIRSNIVIGADGIEHKVGRWAGIYKNTKSDDVLVFLDSMFENVYLDQPYYIYQYIEWKGLTVLFAIFPHGNGKVGLVTQTYHSFHPKKGELFNAENYFVKTHPFFSKSKFVKRGGSIYTGNSLRTFITDGGMLIGDAANHIGKLWGDGILRAMDAGVLAGETAVEAHEEGDFSSNLLSRYEQRWYRLHGKQDILDSYMIKIFTYLSDKQIIAFGDSLKNNDAAFTDEINEIISKTPKITSKLISGLKKEGMDINDMFGFLLHYRKYYRNWWDTFVE